jgi:hypothetical protein
LKNLAFDNKSGKRVLGAQMGRNRAGYIITNVGRIKMHWKEAAQIVFPDLKELICSDDEEYALYNFLHECRERFVVAFNKNDSETFDKILNFIDSCLDNSFQSDSEELDTAAGASFSEHLFDGVDEEKLPVLINSIGYGFYLKSRVYLKKWLDEDIFNEIEAQFKGMSAQHACSRDASSSRP